jgi:hypothetical protein
MQNDKEPIIEDIFENLAIRKQVKVGDRIVNVPTKYLGNVFMGAFPISTKRAKDIIKTDKLRPIELAPGKSIVAITIFSNYDTPVGAYKEIVLSIPILYKPTVTVPLLPFLFRACFKNLGFFVFLIASDTDLSREEGNIFGYPHYEKNIKVLFQQEGAYFYAELEEANKHILSMRVNKFKKEKIEKNDYQTYFIKENKLFRIEMNTYAIVGRSLRKNDGILKLGNHEISELLGNLEINLKPIEFSYYRNSIEVLNLPEEIE